ncbi:MAG TPA: signal recognition particle protein [Planctomycetota bacterium]|nr:signal recognition particle protein [Planctomycetota bacterium]
MFESLTKGFQGLFARFSGGKTLTEDNVKEALRDVRMALLEADVQLGVVRDFLARVKEKALGLQVVQGVDAGQMFVKAIHDELTALMGPESRPFEFPERPLVVLMAGLQGSGKTTTCGKLAHWIRKQHRKSVMLCAADLQRPAAVEQLKVLGRELDVPVWAETGVRAPDVCAHAVAEARAKNVDVVILDTAGRLHVDDALMTELAEVAAKTKPHETFLVCDAMTGQDAVNSAKAFDQRLALTGVVLTKLDGDARGGAALSVKAVTGKPVRFVGVGEKLDKLEMFHPSRMADRILGMGDVVSFVEKAQEVIDQNEAREQAEKMFLGSFTLDDFLKLLQKIKKMGSLKDLLAMVPGMGAQMANMPVDEKEFVRSEAIIQSMTPLERMNPEILGDSRRRRVARGAGVDLEAVHELMRSFREMKKQFQELKKMGVLGSLFDPTRRLRKEKEQELLRMKKLGVNPFDLEQVRAFKQYSQRQAKAEARRAKRRR